MAHESTLPVRIGWFRLPDHVKEINDKLILGVSGTFTTSDSKTVTVTDGIITSIVV